MIRTRPRSSGGGSAANGVPDADRPAAGGPGLRQKHLALVALGLALMVLGFGARIIGYLQPGLTCVEDDSSAGCPATPFYTVMLVLGVVGFTGGSVVLVRAGSHRN